MSRTPFRGALLLALATAPACTDVPLPTAMAPAGASLAKGGPVSSGNRLTSYFWAIGGEYGIRPDDRPYTAAIPGYSEYRHGVCGVKSIIQLENRGGDNSFYPAYGWTQKDKATCVGGAVQRRVTLVYLDDPATEGINEALPAENVSYLHVRRLYYVGNNDWGTTIEPYPAGDPIIADWINTMDINTGSTCGRVWFNSHRYPESSDLLITKLEAPLPNGGTGWEIRSDAAKGHRAWCENRGQAVYLPFALIVQDLGLQS